jgi:hypothetical protein
MYRRAVIILKCLLFRQFCLTCFVHEWYENRLNPPLLVVTTQLLQPRASDLRTLSLLERIIRAKCVDRMKPHRVQDECCGSVAGDIGDSAGTASVQRWRWQPSRLVSINSLEECPLGYKDAFRTSQETHYVSVTEPSRLMLCKIWAFHGGDYEECRLLGCYAVKTWNLTLTALCVMSVKPND